MFDLAHFAMVLYLCVMSPYVAIQNYQTDSEKVINTVVMAGLLLNIYIQLTTAIIEKVIRLLRRLLVLHLVPQIIRMLLLKKALLTKL